MISPLKAPAQSRPPPAGHTFSAGSMLVVTRIALASSSCSAQLSRSAATYRALAPRLRSPESRWPGDAVDAHMAVHGLFRQGHEMFPAHDLIHPGIDRVPKGARPPPPGRRPPRLRGSRQTGRAVRVTGFTLPSPPYRAASPSRCALPPPPPQAVIHQHRGG